MNLLSEIVDLQKMVADLMQRVTVLESENLFLRKENDDLRKENENLRKENDDLRRRLGLKSHNSHKPPSSDGLSKKNKLVTRGINKLGGQKGHEGHTLMSVDNPDKVIIHLPESCGCCGKVFKKEDISTGGHSRQVFDLPEPKLEVIEHRLGVAKCCGQFHRGKFPEGVNAPVQYGTRIKSLVTLLNVEYRMPYEKISQLTGDLFGSSINEATIMSSMELCYNKLESVMESIILLLLQSKVLHFDETGMRVNGKLHWFHTACNEAYSHIFVHEKRGKEALNSTASLLPCYTDGWAVHDCWKSYFEFTNCRHALCGAHLLRELTGLEEQGSIWGQEMKLFFENIYKATEEAGGMILNREEWEEKYKNICDKAELEEPPPIKKARGRSKNTKGRNLLNRLVEYKEGFLAFVFNLEVPFTNNCAEQNIRHIKVKQKVSMSFRTFHGAEIYARIQSFVGTTRKQGQNTFKQLCNILNGEGYAVAST